MKQFDDNAAEFARIAIRVQTENKERDKILRLVIPEIEKMLIQSAENGDHDAFVPAQDNVVIDHLKKLGFRIKVLKRVSTPLGEFFLIEANHEKIIAKIDAWKLKAKRLSESLFKTTKLIDRQIDLEGLLYAECMSKIKNGAVSERIKSLIDRQNTIKDKIDKVKSEAILSVERLTVSATKLTHVGGGDVINKIEWGFTRPNTMMKSDNKETMLSPRLLNNLAETRFKQLISGVMMKIKSAAESGLMHAEITIQHSQHGDKLDIISGAYSNFSESKDVLIYLLKHKGFQCVIKPDSLFLSWGKKTKRSA